MTAMSRFFCRFLPIFLVLFVIHPAYAAFTDHGDGTVTDSVTGLMWDKCSWGQSNDTDCSGGAASTHTWLAALGVAVTANGSSHKGYTDWRLPSRTELESLVKIDASSPAIDGTAFPNTPSNWFWSGTTEESLPVLAGNVDFDDGHANDKSINYHVRLVRVGGVDFVMQPDLSAESGSGNAMEFDFDGEGHLRYRDAQGYRQVLHPAFADFATLRDILTEAIPGIVVRRNNGATTAAIGDATYTLAPDYTLTSAPAQQVGRSWWSGADGKLTIRNADGTAQGFAVR